MLTPVDTADLERFVATLRKDYSKLSVRIRTISHSVKCDCDGVNLRLHAPAISQGQAKITASSMEHELRLVSRNIDMAALSAKQRDLLLTYLDPNEDHENYNKRLDVIACLIGFDFAAYQRLGLDDGDSAFALLATAELQELSAKLSRAFNAAGIKEIKFRQDIIDTRKIIRETLQVIEEAIRFQTIRLFGCYRTILAYALREIGEIKLSEQILDVELFLEIGASSKTMVSLISLGLSRTVAIKLNGARSDLDPELDKKEALEWLRSISNRLATLGLSDLQVSEVTDIILQADKRMN